MAPRCRPRCWARLGCSRCRTVGMDACCWGSFWHPDWECGGTRPRAQEDHVARRTELMMPTQMVSLQDRVELRLDNIKRLRVACPLCADGAKGALCADHAVELRLQASCPRCAIGGGGALCVGHALARMRGRRFGNVQVARHAEEERLGTVCPQCETGAWGPQCRMHLLVMASGERRRALAQRHND